MVLAAVGILTSGVFGGTSLISTTYPGIGGPDPRFTDAFEPGKNFRSDRGGVFPGSVSYPRGDAFFL